MNSAPFEIVTVACLSDNYAFLIRDAQTGRTALVDAPEAAPLIAALEARGWGLDEILLTHHHDDHIQAVPELVARFGAKVLGASADAHRLPALDRAVVAGESFDLFGQKVDVIDVPGHTVGHIAFYFKGALFSGDSLMAAGCGRLFEGTPAQMWESLQTLRALPAETMVYSGHEYTTSNLRFALSQEPENAALQARAEAVAALRAEGGYSVPSRLSDEIATNPFLRADLPEFAAAAGLAGQDPLAVFTEIRTRKNNA